MEWCGSPNRSSCASTPSRLRPLRVSRIALVDSRSWMKSGNVGTSKLSGSALPDQPRNGRSMALSCSTASSKSMHGGKRPAVRAGEPLRLRESMRRGQPGCVRDARQKPLAQPSAAIAFVPTQRRVQRSVIAVGLGWLALFELRLRTHIGPHGAVGRLVLIAFRCLRLGRAKRLSNSHCVPCLFGTVGCHCPCTHSLAPAGRSGTDD